MGRRRSSTSSRLPRIIAYLMCSLVAPVATHRSTTRLPLSGRRSSSPGDGYPTSSGCSGSRSVLFFGFVVFALLIFRSCTSRPATLRLATALVVFWPSSIINAVRVHNDALASVLMLAAMYFIAKWDRDGKRRDFHLALLFCALALLTKASGYALATTLVLFAAVRAIPPELRRQSLKRCVVAIVILGSVAVGAAALRRSRTRAPSVKRCWGMLATVGTCPPSSTDRVVSSVSIYGGSCCAWIRSPTIPNTTTS